MASGPEDLRDDPGRTPIGDGRRPAVLVLDDEPDVLELLTLVLERRGFRVCATADGNGANRLLRDGTFAVALVDLLMPGLSGPEFLEATRGLAPERRPNVLVMSALRRELAEQQIGGLPYFALVTKPFDLSAICDLVARAAAARPPAAP